jgi:predicted nucleic acid-binding protein
MPSSPRSCVVDASLVVRVLQPGHPEIVDLWLQWLDSGWRVCAPSLLVYEVTNALYRSARARRIGPQPLAASLEDLGQMELELVSDVPLSRRAAEIAWALDLPAAYDAHYLALAERLDSELWTCDKKLAQKIGEDLPQMRVSVPIAARDGGRKPDDV